MILDLKNREEFPLQLDQTAESFELESDREDILGVKNVRVKLSVQHSADEFYCQGTVSADFKLECARCLGEFIANIQGKTDFIVRFHQPAAAVEKDKRDIPDDEEYVDLLDDLKADISYIVNQTLLLALPMKPICQESCRGLCPACGINKNNKDCDCKTEAYDERWEGLSGLF